MKKFIFTLICALVLPCSVNANTNVSTQQKVKEMQKKVDTAKKDAQAKAKKSQKRNAKVGSGEDLCGPDQDWNGNYTIMCTHSEVIFDNNLNILYSLYYTYDYYTDVIDYKNVEKNSDFRPLNGDWVAMKSHDTTYVYGKKLSEYITNLHSNYRIAYQYKYFEGLYHFENKYKNTGHLTSAINYNTATHSKQMIERKLYHANNRLKSHQKYSIVNGKSLEHTAINYHSNGRKSSERYHFINKYKQRKLKKAVNYKSNGKMTLFQEYYLVSNGQNKIKNDKRFHSNGKVKSHKSYKQYKNISKLIKNTNYHSNGKKKNESSYILYKGKNVLAKYISQRSNGKKTAEKHYKNYKGKAKLVKNVTFHKNGKKHKETKYKMNKKGKTKKSSYKVWNKKGKLTTNKKYK